MSLELTPKGWRRSKLGECCDIVAGGTPSREREEFWGGSIPWVTPKDISAIDEPVFTDPPEHISDLGLRNSSASILPKGTVLLSSRAPIGLVAIAGRPMATNQGFKSLVPGPNLESRFLYYAIKRMVPVIQARGNGATFKEVSKAVMEEIEISYPATVSEQERIAAILDKADAIRRKRRQALAEIDALLRATFLDMFGDARSNPKNWQILPLERLTQSDRPITYGIVQAGPHVDGGIPYIKTSDFTENEIRTEGLARTSVEIANKYLRSAVRAGDLVFCIRASVGAVGRVPTILDGANLTQGTALIAPGSGVDPNYLLFALRSEGIQSWIASREKGATFKEITLKTLRKTPVPLPPPKLQAQFGRRVRSMLSVKQRLSSAAAESHDCFSSLSQRAFRGEL